MLLVHWSQRWTWQCDMLGRMVAARLEHVDLKVEPPEVIMEVILGVEVEPGVEETGPAEPGWAEELPPGHPGPEAGGGPTGPGWAEESAERAAHVTALAGETGGVATGGACVDAAAGEGYEGNEAAGEPVPGGGGACVADGEGRSGDPGEELMEVLNHVGLVGSGESGDRGEGVGEADRPDPGAEAEPEHPPQSGGEPLVEAGAGKPVLLDRLLWEAFREVRELDAAAARRSVVNVAGLNIVVGGS